MFDLAKHRLLVFFSILVFVISATFLAIKLAQGYRIDFSTKSLKPSGLLVATSVPPGAQVFVDNQLKTATDNTIALPPGKYMVEIKKNGYFPWKKQLVIEKELVTQAEAFLFPQIPDLKPLTFHEAENPLLSPDGTKIIYTLPLPDPEAGLWIMDLTDSPFNIGREPRQIVKSLLGTKDFGKAEYFWSPDSKQILVSLVSPGEKYLLDSNQLNSSSNLINISARLGQTIENWQKEAKIRQEAKFRRIPEKMQEILNSKAEEISFSPDGSKIFYIATASADIPEHLISPVLAASTQPEARSLEEGKVYVYDLKEDKNFSLPFKLPKPTPTAKPTKTKGKTAATPTPFLANPTLALQPQWFPTSRHLFWLDEDKVVACEYDGTNLTTVYAGPFVKPYAFVAPSANRLIVLTKITADPKTKPNLYSVSLK